MKGVAWLSLLLIACSSSVTGDAPQVPPKDALADVAHTDTGSDVLNTLPDTPQVDTALSPPDIPTDVGLSDVQISDSGQAEDAAPSPLNDTAQDAAPSPLIDAVQDASDTTLPTEDTVVDTGEEPLLDTNQAPDTTAASDIAETENPDASIVPDGDQAEIPGGECSDVCGDVDQDGLVSLADLDLLNEVFSGGLSLDACATQSADLKLDGNVTEADALLLEALIGGLVTDTCMACTAACGDIDGDGALTVVDVEILTDSIIDGLPSSGCRYWRSDVNADGIVNVSDVTTIIQMMNVPGSALNCAP